MADEDAISRSEAIRVASGYCHWTNIPYELAKLPSVNPKPCTDAISRQDALDAFGLSEKTRKYGGDHSGYNTMMLYEIQDVIEGLPSVSAEKTGGAKMEEKTETCKGCPNICVMYDQNMKGCKDKMEGVE